MIDNPRIGDYYKLYCYRDHDHEPSILTGRIVNIRDIYARPLKNPRPLLRSQHIITFEARNNSGEKIYRSYYSRFLYGHKLSILGRLYNFVKRSFILSKK
jgi:hypothetical protein